ncbi:MAG: Asp-tRNA(Asn)/Glu-tRNA(Gln) amidotransferase subunit GatC [Candidatus Pacebacteria bacterium]|nr:Asp-tRNA(Asn)/Glu-tRNA(Gln) amidotransferase subunit GatC [Candidatus Paceibacterota bacterium]
MISEKEVRDIAKLSYLKLDEAEIKKMQEDFSSILDYVNKLSEIDAAKILETANLSQEKNVFRKDEPERKSNADILKLMPHTRNGYLEVKKTLDND